MVVCGHTHVQFDRCCRAGVRVVNAGSVGMPYEGRQGAFWALLGPDVELRRTITTSRLRSRRIRAANARFDEELVGYLLEPPDPDEVDRVLRGAVRGT